MVSESRSRGGLDVDLPLRLYMACFCVVPRRRLLLVICVSAIKLSRLWLAYRNGGIIGWEGGSSAWA